MAQTKRNWKEISLEEGNIWDKEAPLEGIFEKADEDVGPNKSKMYTIKTDDGDVKVWGSTVLDDKLMGVPKGSYVKIEYEGKKQGKNGTQYNSYKVFIDLDTSPKEADPETVPLDEVPEDFLR